VFKTTGYIENTTHKKQNIACGFNRRTQRISATILNPERLMGIDTFPGVETTGYIENTTHKSKT
jgi:hypothetical protein